MFQNYFKTAIRSLLRNKGYSLLNILGLAIGMASVILILLWVNNEINTDRFYKDSNRIFVINNMDKSISGEMHLWNWTPKVMGPILQQDYPEVEKMSRISNSSFLFTVGDNKFVMDGSFVDSAFLQIFDFPLLSGNISNSLNGINKIVITEKMSKKLFGNYNAVGKTIKVDSVDLFTVSAVLKDLPSNTTFTFDYLLSWMYLKKLGHDDNQYWGNNSGQTYVKLKSENDLNTFNSKIKNITIEHTKNSGFPSSNQVFAYPLSKSYLYSKVENGKYVAGRAVMVNLFIIIAGLILLIACINFMNLSTARSEKRAREVGIRKVVGAKKYALIIQFITESIVITIVSFIIAIGLVFLVLPFFNTLVGRTLNIPFENIYFWIYSLLIIVVTGLLTGSYPALFLSSFNPITVLKGTFRKPQYKVNPRSILVVIQFTFAIILIISTLVISKQIRFLQNREQGYQQDQLLYSYINGDMEKNYALIRSELLNSGAVTSVTKTMSPITQQWSDESGYSWPNSTEKDKKLIFGRFSADADLFKTIGIKILQGRDIDVYHFPTDSSAILLNETAVKEMHLENPIGVSISNGDYKWHVVGIVKDFIIGFPSAKIGAMMVQGPSSWFGCIHYRLNSKHSSSDNLKKIGNIFKKYNPSYPFDYTFVDQNYAEKFNDIKQIGKLTNLFSCLTIFISCLGLFGLAAFMAESRTKEIGVRKVLGASLTSLCGLLTKDFLKLVIVAIIIAIPISWIVSSKWLTNYTFRIAVPISAFLIAGLLSICIAILTVGFLALKAAKANPTKSLRSE